MTLKQMLEYVSIESYVKPNEEEVKLITCRCCERQKEYPNDTDLSVIEPFVLLAKDCREEGKKH